MGSYDGPYSDKHRSFVVFAVVANYLSKISYYSSLMSAGILSEKIPSVMVKVRGDISDVYCDER